MYQHTTHIQLYSVDQSVVGCGALHKGDVAVVALPNCHWVDGSMVALEAIGEECRRLNIPLACDLTQSAGVVPFSIKR